MPRALPISRRQLLAGVAAGGAALTLPQRLARADVSGDERRFVFVFVHGGWDPTRVFAPEFDNPIVSMEPDAARATVAGLPIVDHPDRPSVRAFFEDYGAALSVVNGLLVPSVAHEACQGLLFTGSTAGRDADWATRIAAAKRNDFALPHLALSRVAFPGQHTELVCRIGRSGQLGGLLDGSAAEATDRPFAAPGAEAEALMDQYVAGRLAERQAAAPNAGWLGQLQAIEFAEERAEELQSEARSLSFDAGSSLSSASELAVRALARGISRCVTIEHPLLDGFYGWDSHSENDTMQSALFEDLFAGLADLMALLESTPTGSGTLLSDKTTIAVVSEMGRTPWLSPAEGKDHWPYTSAMLLGSGVRGGRVIGGLDERFYGRHIDLDSGETFDGGVRPSFAELGATLLALADLDPADAGAVADPITALLA